MTYLKRSIGVLMIAASLTGCATSNNPQDPFEGFNRAMFNFNDALDQAALKPAATVYRDVLPSFVQTAVGNFFGNIGDVWSAVNNLLQGKMADGLSDTMRVAVNTTLGLGGVLDISSEAGMPKHKEDFGQTLGVWGVESGPYVVLPFLGSSTLRDTAALPVDFKGDLWQYTYPVRVRNVGSVLRVVDQRAAVLDASNLIEDAALDRYEFVRDAYLQRRANKVHGDDGPKPRKSDDSSSLEQTPSLSGADRSAIAFVQSAEPVRQTIVQIQTNDGVTGGEMNTAVQSPKPLEETASTDAIPPTAAPLSSNLAAKQLIISTE